MSLEMAKKVLVPQKKIMSRSFLNSGTLIVILYRKAAKYFENHQRQEKSTDLIFKTLKIFFS
jgi:hypothetical protein